jgi:hypothetical protein
MRRRLTSNVVSRLGGVDGSTDSMRSRAIANTASAGDEVSYEPAAPATLEVTCGSMPAFRLWSRYPVQHVGCRVCRVPSTLRRVSQVQQGKSS